MAETRHRTVIEIGVDDRAIRGLDQTMRSAFDERVLSTFERTLDRSARTMERMLRVTERFEQLMRRMPSGAFGGGEGGGGGTGGGGGGTGGGGGGGQNMAALARSIDRLASATKGGGGGGGGGGSFLGRTGSTAVGTYLGNLTSAAAGGNFAQAAAGGIPIVGGAITGAMNQVTSLYGAYAGQQQGILSSVGTMGSRSAPDVRDRRNRGGFTSYGLDRAQAAGQMAQFSRGTGMEASALSSGTVRDMLRAQFYGGIQGGGAELIRAQQMGAEDRQALSTGGSNTLRQTLGYGQLANVGNQRLGQFTGGIARTVEQQRMSGGGLNVAAAGQAAAGLAGLQAPEGGISGFGGEAGATAAQGAIQRMQQFEPGQMDMKSMIMLRAAGWGVEDGVTYHQALRRIQGNDPEYPIGRVIQNAQTIFQQMGGGAGTPQTVELVRRLAPSMFGFGAQITQAEAFAGGSMELPDGQRAEDIGAAFLQSRQQRLQGAASTPATEAGFRNRQARLGGQSEIRQAAVELRNFNLEMAKTILPGIVAATRRVVGWIRRLWDAFAGGGSIAAAGAAAGGLGGEADLAGGGTNGPDMSFTEAEAYGSPQSGSRRGTPVPPEFRGSLPSDHPLSGFERGVQDIQRSLGWGQGNQGTGGAPGPGATGSGAGGASSAGDDMTFTQEEAYGSGPQAAAGALRRAADIIESMSLPGEGDLAYG